MKTLDQFITYYCEQHRNRIEKQIAKEKYEDTKQRLLEEKDHFTRKNADLVARLTLWHQSLVTKQPENLCRFDCLSINKIIWKTVAYTLGIPTFKTEKHLHAWMQIYYGESYTTWKEQREDQKKQKKEKEQQQRLIDDEQRKQFQNERTIHLAHELKFSTGESIHQFTESYYGKGYRLTQVRQGFGFRNRIENPSTGQYAILSAPRRKTHFHHQFTETIYTYYAIYESQQSTKKPSLTERFPFKKTCLLSA